MNFENPEKSNFDDFFEKKMKDSKYFKNQHLGSKTLQKKKKHKVHTLQKN